MLLGILRVPRKCWEFSRLKEGVSCLECILARAKNLELILDVP